MAQHLSKKTGIPIPLVTAIIASGIVGGPAAVPFAAFMYFIKKPLMKGASKAFDMGVQGVQKGANAIKGTMQPQVATEMYFPSFSDYVYQEGFGDWAGQKIGSVEGSVAGKTTGLTKKISGVLTNSWQGLTKFASENKLAIAKTAFLMGVGALIGAGIGKLTHDAIDSVVQAIGDRGLSPEEMANLNWLRNNLAMDDNAQQNNPNSWIKTDKDGLAHGGGSGNLFTKPGHENDADFNNPNDSIAVSGVDWMNDSSENMDKILSKLKDTFGSSVRTELVGKPETATGILDYSITVKPEPGQSQQSILQMIYRTLAKDMQQQGIEMKDLKYSGTDPSGAIKAALSVAPNLTTPGAVGAAVGMAAAPNQKYSRPV